jgi:hypothetical protein
MKEHWREYLIEAWGLGTFMVSAGVFATLLYSPSSTIPTIIPHEFLRGLVMGIAMGLTAIAIWIGLMLDDISESLAIGSSLVHSQVSLSAIAGLFLSNYPEALSSSIGMRQQGLSWRRVLLMWTSVMAIATRQIEQLLFQLRENYTIVIVTHNMQQASRTSDWTAFFNVETNDQGEKTGYLVEYNPTKLIFSRPQQQATRDYVSGRFG